MSYSIDQALEMAKNFTESRKNGSRPALRGAYVDDEYVWATDSIWLIRVEHNETVETSYLHGYSRDDKKFFSSGEVSYPNCRHLIPNLLDYSCKITTNDLNEWVKAHELICIMRHNEYHTTLNTYERTVRAKSMEKGLIGGSMAFVYHDLPFEEEGSPTKLYYNAKVMLKILKLAQKQNVPSVTFYIYGARKTFVVEMDGVLIVVMKLQEEYRPVPEKKKREPKPKKEKEEKPKKEPKPKVKPKAKSKPKAKAGKK